MRIGSSLTRVCRVTQRGSNGASKPDLRAALRTARHRHATGDPPVQRSGSASSRADVNLPASHADDANDADRNDPTALTLRQIKVNDRGKHSRETTARRRKGRIWMMMLHSFHSAGYRSPLPALASAVLQRRESQPHHLSGSEQNPSSLSGSEQNPIISLVLSRTLSSLFGSEQNPSSLSGSEQNPTLISLVLSRTHYLSLVLSWLHTNISRNTEVSIRVLLTERHIP
ncbi:unnamed protein product [Arctogadus glacialis]